ncbi:sulfotransferase family protein [Marinobacter pelagius]|uniref:sulfotransferase family 2 domain-containing protein n=1 Tax=Marinobacter sp. C7 TaxID=2951363 RepID=UPI001EF12A13|nr:sulfotransferase family 2 domain-containing protein [Marinobacter sp. C7]MCG7199107.1 sulfotransferase family protein [Marinobacter sp. C7]
MISHKHKCIFVHIPKCGGQSIEDIFIRENGLTWKTRAPLLLRKNRDQKKGPPRLAHLTYVEYISLGYISPKMMKEYTKFSIVRDPYKRVESLYKFLGYDAAIPFERFICEIFRPQMENKGKLHWFLKPQVDYLRDEYGVIKVDHVVKLEQLSEEMPKVLEEIGLKVDKIPHINKSSARGKLKTLAFRLFHAINGCFTWALNVDSEIAWTEDLLTVVNEYYADDFDQFDYSRRLQITTS